MMTAEEWHDFKINAVEAQESQYLKLCYEAGALGLVDLCQELFRWAEERRATLQLFRRSGKTLSNRKP